MPLTGSPDTLTHNRSDAHPHHRPGAPASKRPNVQNVHTHGRKCAQSPKTYPHVRTRRAPKPWTWVTPSDPEPTSIYGVIGVNIHGTDRNPFCWSLDAGESIPNDDRSTRTGEGRGRQAQPHLPRHHTTKLDEPDSVDL